MQACDGSDDGPATQETMPDAMETEAKSPPRLKRTGSVATSVKAFVVSRPSFGRSASEAKPDGTPVSGKRSAEESSKLSPRPKRQRTLVMDGPPSLDDALPGGSASVSNDEPWVHVLGSGHECSPRVTCLMQEGSCSACRHALLPGSRNRRRIFSCIASVPSSGGRAVVIVDPGADVNDAVASVVHARKMEIRVVGVILNRVDPGTLAGLAAVLTWKELYEDGLPVCVENAEMATHLREFSSMFGEDRFSEQVCPTRWRGAGNLEGISRVSGGYIIGEFAIVAGGDSLPKDINTVVFYVGGNNADVMKSALVVRALNIVFVGLDHTVDYQYTDDTLRGLPGNFRVGYDGMRITGTY